MRPPSDPAGFGLNIAFANIPDTYSVLGVAAPISVDELIDRGHATGKGRPIDQQTVTLTLPTKVFAPDAVPLINDHVFCADPSSGTGKTVGTASSTSPLYPMRSPVRIF